MKNVTISMDEELLAHVRVEAARAGKSVSRFVADLLARQWNEDDKRSALLEQFLTGQGYPGVGRTWEGREALYAEREDELLRRYESSRLRDRREGDRQDAADQASDAQDHR